MNYNDSIRNTFTVELIKYNTANVDDGAGDVNDGDDDDDDDDKTDYYMSLYSIFIMK